MNLFENLFGIGVIVRSFLIVAMKRKYFVILFFFFLFDYRQI